MICDANPNGMLCLVFKIVIVVLSTVTLVLTLASTRLLTQNYLTRWLPTLMDNICYTFRQALFLWRTWTILWVTENFLFNADPNWCIWLDCCGVEASHKEATFMEIIAHSGSSIWCWDGNVHLCSYSHLFMVSIRIHFPNSASIQPGI